MSCCDDCKYGWSYEPPPDGSPAWTGCKDCLDGSHMVPMEEEEEESGEEHKPLVDPRLVLSSFTCGPRQVSFSYEKYIDSAGLMNTISLECQINLDLKDKDDARQHTELHEAVHAMDAVYGLDFNEKQTDALASALLQFLRTVVYK